MASAALFSQGIQHSKHAGIEAAFSQFLVKSGQIESEFSRFYQREAVDYADIDNVDQIAAQQTVTNAERFVHRLEKFLRT